MHWIKGPSVSRRDVVAGLCASGLLGACSAGTAPEQEDMVQPQAAAANGQALATGEKDGWARLVGTEFTTSGFRLKLTGVSSLPSAGARPPDVTRDAAFLAVFEVLSGGVMPGDLIYRMSTRSQVLDVFLGSAASREFPNNMHAVFN
jgi:hypothetical protein